MDLQSDNARRLFLAISVLVLLYGIYDGVRAADDAIRFFAYNRYAVADRYEPHAIIDLVSPCVIPFCLAAVYLVIGCLLVRAVRTSPGERPSGLAPPIGRAVVVPIGWLVIAINIAGLVVSLLLLSDHLRTYRLILSHPGGYGAQPGLMITLMALGYCRQIVWIAVGVLLVFGGRSQAAPTADDVEHPSV